MAKYKTTTKIEYEFYFLFIYTHIWKNFCPLRNRNVTQCNITSIPCRFYKSSTCINLRDKFSSRRRMWLVQILSPNQNYFKKCYYSAILRQNEAKWGKMYIEEIRYIQRPYIEKRMSNMCGSGTFRCLLMRGLFSRPKLLIIYG